MNGIGREEVFRYHRSPLSDEQSEFSVTTRIPERTEKACRFQTKTEGLVIQC